MHGRVTDLPFAGFLPQTRYICTKDVGQNTYEVWCLANGGGGWFHPIHVSTGSTVVHGGAVDFFSACVLYRPHLDWHCLIFRQTNSNAIKSDLLGSHATNLTQVHLVNFYTILRDDIPLEPYEAFPKDTIQLHPGNEAFVVARFGPHVGESYLIEALLLLQTSLANGVHPPAYV